MSEEHDQNKSKKRRYQDPEKDLESSKEKRKKPNHDEEDDSELSQILNNIDLSLLLGSN